MTIEGLVLPGALRTTSTAMGSPPKKFQLKGKAPGWGKTPGHCSGQVRVRRKVSMSSQRQKFGLTLGKGLKLKAMADLAARGRPWLVKIQAEPGFSRPVHSSLKGGATW